MTTNGGVVLDAGAFIALERRNRVMVHLTERFTSEKTPLVTSAGVVAQVWRGGSGGQAPIAFLLRRTEVVDLTHAMAKVVGKMLGLRGMTDPVDAHVALIARQRGFAVLTSDPDDLLAIDPGLTVERI